MPELEFVEFNAMIIGIVALLNFPFLIKRRKDFTKYLPGVILMILGFIFENIEEIFFHHLFATLESISIVLGAILLTSAIIIELNMAILKNRDSQPILKKIKGKK